MSASALSVLNAPQYFQDIINKTEFDIEFQFKSRLLEALLTANFGHAVDRLMTCFEARAGVLYGSGKRSG